MLLCKGPLENIYRDPERQHCQHEIKAAPLGFVIYWFNSRQHIFLPLLFPLLTKSKLKWTLSSGAICLHLVRFLMHRGLKQRISSRIVLSPGTFHDLSSSFTSVTLAATGKQKAKLRCITSFVDSKMVPISQHGCWSYLFYKGGVLRKKKLVWFVCKEHVQDTPSNHSYHFYLLIYLFTLAKNRQEYVRYSSVCSSQRHYTFITVSSNALVLGFCNETHTHTQTNKIKFNLNHCIFHLRH